VIELVVFNVTELAESNVPDFAESKETELVALGD